MGQLEPGFDANQVEPNQPRETIRPGDYLAMMVDSEEQDNKAGTGTFHKLVFEITEGEHKGRKLTDRLNLNNPNAEAVRIAYGTLSTICRAVNVMQPKHTSELHNLPIVIVVKLAKRKDTNEDTNEIVGYKPKSEFGKSKPATPGTAPKPPGPGGPGAKPWGPKA